MGRPYPSLPRGTNVSLCPYGTSPFIAVVFFSPQIGDTSLPVERPEMLDDDLLKQLHHVLLEVSQHVMPLCALNPFPLTQSISGRFT